MGRRGADIQAAFAELVRQHGDKAYNFAYRLSGQEADAKDLVQEAFTKAYEHFSSYDQSRPFDSWLLRILHNIYLDGVRRYSHSRSVSLDAPAPVDDSSWEEILPSADLDPSAALSRRESGDLLQRALDSVAWHYRTAVVLCDIERLPYEQISAIMDCPIGTVRSRIHQGRMLIRKAFEELERGGGDCDERKS